MAVPVLLHVWIKSLPQESLPKLTGTLAATRELLEGLLGPSRPYWSG